jgi:hypothetical protein
MIEATLADHGKMASLLLIPRKSWADARYRAKTAPPGVLRSEASAARSSMPVRRIGFGLKDVLPRDFLNILMSFSIYPQALNLGLFHS